MENLSVDKCKHDCLHFALGGVYLICCECGQRYGALKGATDVLDSTAFTHHVGINTHRTSPFSAKLFLPHEIK